MLKFIFTIEAAGNIAASFEEEPQGMQRNISKDFLNKTSLSAAIAEKINEMIIQQNMKPGTKLPSEGQLSEWYRVSRPTIREAMKTLKAQNIVVIRQGDGTYVSNFTGMGEDPLGLRYIEKETLTESVFEVRLLIEPKIAMLAATRASADDIKELRKIVKQMQLTDYKDAARLELDIQFHTLIAKSSKNAVFNQIMPVIYETIEKGIVILQESEESHKRAQHMHMEIYEALARRDICKAESAVSAHIYSSLNDIKLLQMEKKGES